MNLVIYVLSILCFNYNLYKIYQFSKYPIWAQSILVPITIDCYHFLLAHRYMVLSPTKKYERINMDMIKASPIIICSFMHSRLRIFH